MYIVCLKFRKRRFMTMKIFSLLAVFSLFAVLFPVSATRVLAQEDSEESRPALVKSATGYDMPKEQVSSDITVITKEEISHLPAHDVAEVIRYTTGVVIDQNGGPGIYATPSIQGSEAYHIKVVIDDIPLDLHSGDFIELSMLPLENIERIEILKGSASSVWGASLGGLINIVTKKPSDNPTADIGISVGENGTRRYNGLVSGKEGGFGYLLTVGRFETDGFYKNQDAETNTMYAKANTELGGGYSAVFSFGHSDNKQGEGEIYDPYSDITLTNEHDTRDSYGKFGIEYSNDRDLNLSVSGYDRVYNYNRKDIIDSIEVGTNTGRDDTYGLILKSDWKYSGNGALSAGAEGSHVLVDWASNPESYDADRRAVYANNVHTVGPLTLNIGARYDDDSVFGSDISPSAGIVIDVGHSTLVRFNAAKGFTPPPLMAKYWGNGNSDLHAERALTYQAGIESRIVPMLTAKATFFRADITDMLDWIFDTSTYEPDKVVNIKKARRQGVEIEARSDEYKGISLSYGYAFNDIRDLDTDTVVTNKARITHDIGVNYRGPLETMTTVKGRFVDWNADDGWPYNAKDQNIIWDAKVSKYMAQWKGAIGEMFLSVHNITDEQQYLMEIFPNPGRWVEAGVTLSFY